MALVQRRFSTSIMTVSIAATAGKTVSQLCLFPNFYLLGLIQILVLN